MIAGTGPFEEKLKKKASGDERIEFLGYISEQKKADYFDVADLFVLPTHHDPWGLVVNEAINYGTPVITTEAAGAKELLVEENIFAPRDTETLAHKLKDSDYGKNKSVQVRKGYEGLKLAIEKVKE